MLLLSLFLFAVRSTDCNAQRNASQKAEKGDCSEGPARASPIRRQGRPRELPAKAMKEQEKKEARRDREDEKTY
ncbi:MAG: hypothetical protein MZV63_17970 [Marinilabiliales bacterium]|nr:hypothetical protein [Marinilabiliales bacterium]